MIVANHLNLRSRVFGPGHFKSHLEFATRGLPRTFLAHEQHLSHNYAIEQYAPAIQTLDSLGVNLDHYTSGVTGAAIIMLTLFPETVEFWDELACKRVMLDKDGFSAVGLLLYHLERCKNIGSLTRKPDYQLFLFQAALSLASVWRTNRSGFQRYRKLPRTPDAASLIDQIRKRLGAKNQKDGFRPESLIRNNTHLLDPPDIAHDVDPERLLRLATTGSNIMSERISTGAIKDALSWILKLNPDPELAHPAGMAAAALTIARYSQAREVWTNVFQRNGLWRPNPEDGRWESNGAGMILRRILIANRAELNDQPAGVELFQRILATFELREKIGDVMRRIAPPINPSEKLASAWGSLQKDFAPAITFITPYQRTDGSDTDESAPKKTKKKHKFNPDIPRKRLQTGREGEQHFLQHYRSVFPQFESLELLDRREHADGYDMLFEAPNRELIEVKTVRKKPDGTIGLTNRQWDTALETSTGYWLVIVVLKGAKQDPEMIVLNNPAHRLRAKRRESRVVQVRYEVSLRQIRELADQTC